MMPRLVLPSEEYLDSYLEACRGYKEKGVTLYRLHDPDEYERWRHTIFQGYEDYRNGVNLRPGHVPETVFWMIEDGAYIGNGNLRHRLTEELLKKGGHIGYAIRVDRWGMGYGTLMLKLLLEEAAKLGIDRARVTCAESNIASARVMEKNGGVYEDTIDHVADGVSSRIKRYWIDTPIIRNQYVNTAHLYDFDQRDVLTEDIPFYLSYAHRQRGEVLELACGTGRVSMELARAGFSVTGLDLSEQMLDVFLGKLASADPEVRERVLLAKGNMASFHLGKRYSLIIVPFRAFQSLTDDAEIKSSLACVREHLTGDGLFILDVFRPYKVLGQDWCYPEAVQWERDDEATGSHIVKTHRGDRIDPDRQIIYPSFTYTVTQQDGHTERLHEHLSLKYYYEDQMRALLAGNGLRIIEEYGWYDGSSIAGGRELIFVCQRAD